MISAFIKGIFLGISLVLPLGPQNLFIFQTGTQEKKFYRIFLVVCLAGVCDALLILGAIHGSSLINKVQLLSAFLTCCGILFLLYFGYKTWRQTVNELSVSDIPLNLVKQLLFCFTISIMNPHAIVDTFVVIGAVATEYTHNERQWFGLGCIFIDFIWFSFLGSTGFYIRKMKQNEIVIKSFNRVSSVIMFYIAFDLIVSFFNK